MPIQGSVFRLPCGAQAARCDCSGTISEEDAKGWIQEAGPGGPFYGLPVLAVTLRIEHLGPGARGAFAQRNEASPSPERWMAVVVTSPMIRVTTNFIVRVSGTKTLRLFQTEEEAIRWLDERVQEKAAP